MKETFIVKKLEISNGEKNLVDIKFKVDKSCAIVGQSGSGKTLTLKSILNLAPSNLTINLELNSSFEQNSNNISYVPQNPFTSLSPLTKIKNQILLPLEEQIKYLNLVNLSSDFLEKYPNQLSGGQLQRIVIAIALSSNPKLLLLDEPTTALDHTTKLQIINLIKTLQEEYQFKIIFVTHDIHSIGEICEDIIVLYLGTIVEEGTTNEILQNPKHPYTKKLIDSSFTNRLFRN